MKLHCLGTSGYHPNQRRHTSCYFLPEAGLVLDAGTGIFRLPKLIQTNHLDILLSHAHLDHIVGLTFLLDILHQRPVEQVRVWGDPEKLAAIRTHLFSEFIFPVQLDVEWCPLCPDQPVMLNGGPMLRSFPLRHPGGSLGFHLTWPDADKTLAYVTDSCSQLDAPWLPVIADADLLMHECNFRDAQQTWAEKTGHSWTRRACEIARATHAKQLLLTHTNALDDSEDPVGLEDARLIFSNTNVAQDETVVEF